MRTKSATVCHAGTISQPMVAFGFSVSTEASCGRLGEGHSGGGSLLLLLLREVGDVPHMRDRGSTHDSVSLGDVQACVRTDGRKKQCVSKRVCGRRLRNELHTENHLYLVPVYFTLRARPTKPAPGKNTPRHKY